MRKYITAGLTLPAKAFSVLFCPENIGLKLQPSAKKTERNLIVVTNIHPFEVIVVVHNNKRPAGCSLIGAFLKF